MTTQSVGFADKFELGYWEKSTGYSEVLRAYIWHVKVKMHCSPQRDNFTSFPPPISFFLLFCKKEISRESEFPNQCEAI